jgi:hypothetical protein
MSDHVHDTGDMCDYTVDDVYRATEEQVNGDESVGERRHRLHGQIQSLKAESKKLRDLLQQHEAVSTRLAQELHWLVSLDDVDAAGLQRRRAITLNRIIIRARAALSDIEEV